MKPWMKYLFPFLYSAIFIVAPHYLLNASYWISNLLMFVIPIAVFSIFGFKEIVKNWKPYLILFLIGFPMTFGYEYFCLWLDIWNFNTTIHPLIGIRIFGAPVEELIFWAGALLLMPCIYIYFRSIKNMNYPPTKK